MYSAISNHSNVENLFYKLWRFDQEGVPKDFRDSYEYTFNTFIGSLTNDVNVAIAFFENLNLNEEFDSYAMSFVKTIVQRLETQEERNRFIDCIAKLNKKYPDTPYINWKLFGFFIAINSTNDEDLNKSSSSEDTLGESFEN